MQKTGLLPEMSLWTLHDSAYAVDVGGLTNSLNQQGVVSTGPIGNVIRAQCVNSRWLLLPFQLLSSSPGSALCAGKPASLTVAGKSSWHIAGERRGGCQPPSLPLWPWLADLHAALPGTVEVVDHRLPIAHGHLRWPLLSLPL
mmetsp:Transcript_54683/g.97564  ORF Transcript_54683/g.97564 Transcript_54683/m.97564 type:complete len:143 (-) Transcript_54683:143-571(-)